MYASLRDFRNDDKPARTIGPWPFAQITYDTLRAGDPDTGDAMEVAHWHRPTSEWVLDADGSTWTDITLHVHPTDAMLREDGTEWTR